MNSELQRLERLATETGNPVFAWAALALCEHPADVPDWTFAYLRDCAIRLAALEADPAHLAGGVLDALGLVGPGGPGCFRRAQVARRRLEIVTRINDLRDSGLTVDEAAAAVSEEVSLTAQTVRGYYFEEVRKTGVVLPTATDI